MERLWLHDNSDGAVMPDGDFSFADAVGRPAALPPATLDTPAPQTFSFEEAIGKPPPATVDSNVPANSWVEAMFGPPFRAKEPPDLSGQYNTVLPPEQEAKFQAWAADRKAATGRDPLKDTFDYDIRGAWASGATADGNGHLPDTFKKPNHPTFSNESQYNGVGGQIGGSWVKGRDGSLAFQPSETNINMHGADGLSDYFALAEPNAKLLPPALPTGYVGDGRPYQSGWKWGLFNQDQPMDFVPDGTIKVPGQTRVQAAGNAAGAQLLQGFGQMAAAVPRLAANSLSPFELHDLPLKDRSFASRMMAIDPQNMSPEDRAKAEARYNQWRQESTALANSIASAVADSNARYAPVDPKYTNDIAVNLAGGAGGLAPMVLGTMLGGVGGGAFVAGVQGYESTSEDALAHGATPHDAHTAGMVGGAVSAGLMTVPAAQWLGGLTPAIRQPLVNAIVGTAVHSGSMVGIMQTQTLADNLIARNTYDPTRPVTQGLGEHITDQALLGAFLPLATHSVPHLASRLFEPLSPIASDRFQQYVLGTHDASFPAFDAVDQEPGALVPPTITGPLADAITAQMRYAGLPPNVGVRLMNQVAGGSADSS